jgi:hypothetical protein
VIEPIRKEFSTIAAQVIQDELLHIRKLYTSRGTQVVLPAATSSTTTAFVDSSQSVSTDERANHTIAQSRVLTSNNTSQSDLSIPDVSLDAGKASFSIDDEEEA